MSGSTENFEVSAGCEAAPDLNGKDASFRNAPMISAPATVQKRRIRGALVPMRKTQ